jgi:hypothetical protein
MKLVTVNHDTTAKPSRIASRIMVPAPEGKYKFARRIFSRTYLVYGEAHPSWWCRAYYDHPKTKEKTCYSHWSVDKLLTFIPKIDFVIKPI